MLLPYGDEPNDPKRIAWMNYALIGANVIAFLIMKAQAPTDALEAQWFFEYGYQPGNADATSLLTSMFTHAGWMHLGGNMLFLWIFGDNIEARLGAVRYLIVYLVVGAAATLTFAAFNQDSLMPLVGASGAISGVQGLYFIACPQHRVKVFVWFYFFITVLHVKARWIMLFWFIMQDLIPTLISLKVNVGGNVAHLAHLGGFVSGLALMLLLKPMIKQIDVAAAAELGRSHRYTGGRVSSKRYERTRRRDPYQPGAYRRPERRAPDARSYDGPPRPPDEDRRLE